MTPPGARFAARVFFWAGVYGLMGLMPQYFLEARIGVDAPPPITHPEYFYGFVGVGIAWQLAFLAISRDPLRLRLVMLPAVVEKLSFAGSTFGLYLAGRATATVAAFATIDLALGILFLVAFLRTRSEA
ncbi:MAG TPA: hypothetical protein VLT60_04740 [Usitatibacter sp.]|nr:hypothetical protein [Usitatibacter sp.]